METKRHLREKIEQKDFIIRQLKIDLEDLRSAKRHAEPLPPCKDFGCYGCVYASMLYDHLHDSYTLMGCMKDSYCKDYRPRPDKRIEFLRESTQQGDNGGCE